MKKILYYFCFLVVGIPVLIQLVCIIINIFSPLRLSSWYEMLLYFRSPIPPFFKDMVPRIVNTAVTYIMIFFVLRRIWFLRLSISPPTTFHGLPYMFAWLSFIGFGLAILGYGVFFIAGVQGTSAPAAMLLIPTILFAPWAFLITEVFSLKKVKKENPF